MPLKDKTGIASAAESGKMRLEFPGGPGAAYRKDMVTGKHTPEKIVKTIKSAGWESGRILRDEHVRHGEDWLNTAKHALTFKEFKALQEAVLADTNTGIYQYVHRTRGSEVAVYARRIKFGGRLYEDVGLIFRESDQVRAGFYRINRGIRHFEEQSDFAVIRSAKVKK